MEDIEGGREKRTGNLKRGGVGNLCTSNRGNNTWLRRKDKHRRRAKGEAEVTTRSIRGNKGVDDGLGRSGMMRKTRRGESQRNNAERRGGETDRPRRGKGHRGERRTKVYREEIKAYTKRGARIM